MVCEALLRKLFQQFWGYNQDILDEICNSCESSSSLQPHCRTSSAKVLSESGDKYEKQQLAKDSLDKMLKDIYTIRSQVSNCVSNDSLDKCRVGWEFLFSLLRFNIFADLQ